MEPEPVGSLQTCFVIILKKSPLSPLLQPNLNFLIDVPPV